MSSTTPVYKHILVATDGSKLADRAVVHGIALAKAFGAKLTMFYASPDFPLPEHSRGVVYERVTLKKEYAAEAERESKAILDKAAARAKAAGVACATAHAYGDEPWQAILAAAAKYKCDAIVMASHGRHGLSAVLLGSETQKVLAHGRLPVLVVR